MATTFYFPSSGAVGASPSASTQWTNAASMDRYKLVTTRVGSAMASKTRSKVSGTSGSTKCLVQYVSDPLTAQTISGTIKGQLRGAESNGNFNATLAITARLVKEDGSDYASPKVLFSAVQASDLTSSSPPEFGTGTPANRGFQTSAESFSLTLTSTDAAAGDRLVIEVGYRAASTSTTYTGTVVVGDDSATLLTEQGSETTANTPWVQFSGTIVFKKTQALAATMALTPGLSKIRRVKKTLGGSQTYTELLTTNQKGVETDLTGFDFYGGTLTRDTTVKHSGNASALLTSNSTLCQIIFDDVNVTAGHTLHFEGYLYCDVSALDGEVFAVRYTWGGGSNNQQTFTIDANRAWQKITWEYVVPVGETTCELSLFLAYNVSGDKLYYDDGTFYDTSTVSGGGNVAIALVPVLNRQKKVAAKTQIIAATMALIGTLNTRHRFKKTITSQLTLVGNIRKKIKHKLVSTLALVGVVNKKRKLKKSLVSQLTFVSNIKKKIKHKLVSSISLVGAIVKKKTFKQAISDQLQFVGTLNTKRKLKKSLTSQLTFVSNIRKKTKKKLVSTIALVGTITKKRKLKKSLVSQLALVGIVKKKSKKPLVSTIHLTSNLTNKRRLKKTLVSSLSFVSNIRKKIKHKLTSILTLTPTLNRRRSLKKSIPSTISYIGAINKKRKLKVGLNSTLTLISTLRKKMKKHLTTTIGLISAINTRTAGKQFQQLAATLKYNANITDKTRFKRVLATSMQLNGSLKRKIKKPLQATIHLTSNIQKHLHYKRILQSTTKFNGSIQNHIRHKKLLQTTIGYAGNILTGKSSIYQQLLQSSFGVEGLISGRGKFRNQLNAHLGFTPNITYKIRKQLKTELKFISTLNRKMYIHLHSSIAFESVLQGMKNRFRYNFVIIFDTKKHITAIFKTQLSQRTKGFKTARDIIFDNKIVRRVRNL